MKTKKESGKRLKGKGKRDEQKRKNGVDIRYQSVEPTRSTMCLLASNAFIHRRACRYRRHVDVPHGGFSDVGSSVGADVDRFRNWMHEEKAGSEVQPSAEVAVAESNVSSGTLSKSVACSAVQWIQCRWSEITCCVCQVLLCTVYTVGKW